MRIGIVAGEASGDQLAASLIRAIRAQHPDVEFEGIAGPAMQAAGCRALFPSEKLSVMGLVEVLKHLPELLRIRRTITRHFVQQPPDVFIGVDAPDFNLGLEKRLRTAGIATVHYVSPSIWAWRAGRAAHIGECADRVLCLFPFEPDIYARHGAHAEFVGHPMADEIPLETDAGAARTALNLPADHPVLALLPGSRRSEISRLGPVFLQTARQLQSRFPNLHCVAPMATAGIRDLFEQQAAQHAPGLALTLLDGRAREAIAAADAVLLASGTATLETLLLGRPMAVAYKLAPLSYALVRLFRLLKVPHYALPNILAGREIVPEFMQQRARPELLVPALTELLQDSPVRAAQCAAFAPIHRQLRRQASERAAAAVLKLAASVKVVT